MNTCTQPHTGNTDTDTSPYLRTCSVWMWKYNFIVEKNGQDGKNYYTSSRLPTSSRSRSGTSSIYSSWRRLKKKTEQKLNNINTKFRIRNVLLRIQSTELRIREVQKVADTEKNAQTFCQKSYGTLYYY